MQKIASFPSRLTPQKESFFCVPCSHVGVRWCHFSSFIILPVLCITTSICFYQKEVFLLQVLFTCGIFSRQNISHALEHSFSILQSARHLHKTKEPKIKGQTIKREAIQPNGLISFAHMALLTLIKNRTEPRQKSSIDPKRPAFDSVWNQNSQRPYFCLLIVHFDSVIRLDL